MSERMMNAWEICRSYRDSADKKKQITILEELNACSSREICEILKDGGEDVDMRWARQKRPKEEAVRKKNDAERLTTEPETGDGGPPRASAPAEATGDDVKPLTARELKELLDDVPDDAEIYVPERTVIKARTYVITERETGAKVDKPPRLELIFELKGGIILGHREAV